jgi:hypothetical protein
MNQCLERREFHARDLISRYPPNWNEQNKLQIFEISCSSSCPFEGDIVFARWPEIVPPASVIPESCEFHLKNGIFQYGDPDPGLVAWHVNFADPDLFFAYSSSLFAQDEIQVCEHPVLGSLREALIAGGVPPRTVDCNGRPTPITISGVQRRCGINSKPTADFPGGLYGKMFLHARDEQIADATKAITPPTLSNILAMAAPACQGGLYGRDQLSLILNTAYTGFVAARSESCWIGTPNSRVVVHTGFWGCGAFGGNRGLMTILQCLAADLAGVDLVFWSFDDQGLEIAREARSTYVRWLNSGVSLFEILTVIEKTAFVWGESDGN